MSLSQGFSLSHLPTGLTGTITIPSVAQISLPASAVSRLWEVKWSSRDITGTETGRGESSCSESCIAYVSGERDAGLIRDSGCRWNEIQQTEGQVKGQQMPWADAAVGDQVSWTTT